MSLFGTNVTTVNVYRKVSNLDVPFWGLTKNRIDQLCNAAEDFYVRFDYNGGSITLTSAQVDTLLSTKVPSSDGDYKITLKDLHAIL